CTLRASRKPSIDSTPFLLRFLNTSYVTNRRNVWQNGTRLTRFDAAHLELKRAGNADAARLFSHPRMGGNSATPAPPAQPALRISYRLSSRESASGLANRTSEKCPSGGMARRSISSTPCERAAHCANRAHGNSVRQPSLRAIGWNQCSIV